MRARSANDSCEALREELTEALSKVLLGEKSRST
jgi:hypothetical protein